MSNEEKMREERAIWEQVDDDMARQLVITYHEAAYAAGCDETTKERYQREHYGYVEQLENELKAAKQHNLELLSVIESISGVQVGCCPEALREHEAKVLEYAKSEISKSFGIVPLVNGNYQSGFLACHRDCIDALARMAEERRKK